MYDKEKDFVCVQNASSYHLHNSPSTCPNFRTKQTHTSPIYVEISLPTILHGWTLPTNIAEVLYIQIICIPLTSLIYVTNHTDFQTTTAVVNLTSYFCWHGTQGPPRALPMNLSLTSYPSSYHFNSSNAHNHQKSHKLLDSRWSNIQHITWNPNFKATSLIASYSSP